MATALALARRDMNRVYERRPAPATAGVTLWPNAGFVLADLELLDEVLALGGTPAAMHRYDAQGWSLGGLDIEPLDRLMGYPTCAILRTDLQAVLLRRAREAGVPVAFGREATAIANDPDGRAVVHFADGGHARPDLIIGADGRMSSVARAHVAGGNAPVYQGFVNWIGVAESSRDLVDGAAIHDYWGTASASASWRWGGARSIGRARRRRRWSRRARRRPPRRTASGARCAACSKLARSHRRGHRCHAAAGLRLIAVHDLEPLARWHRGNVLLVGDAARAPLSGQGACRAGGCLASGALPGGSGHGSGRGTGAGAGTVRRIAAGRKPRPSRGRRGTSRESCSSPTRRLAASATRACALAIRCKASRRWRRGGERGCLSTLEQADAGMAVAAGMGAGR